MSCVIANDEKTTFSDFVRFLAKYSLFEILTKNIFTNSASERARPTAISCQPRQKNSSKHHPIRKIQNGFAAFIVIKSTQMYLPSIVLNKTRVRGNNYSVGIHL